MRPYFEQDGITLYLADCREVLPTLAVGSVDLLLTDPPYGAGYRMDRRSEAFSPIRNDDAAGRLLVREMLLAALRPLRQHRHAYIFGRWQEDALPLGGLCELIWDKVLLGAGSQEPWAIQHEYITFGVKANGSQRAQGDGGRVARLRRGSVLRYMRPSGPQVRYHPTEKPVPLLRELIEASSRLGETVLDPFAGSGSTLVAALLEGRGVIGIEIEEAYCEIAVKRLQQSVLPMEFQEVKQRECTGQLPMLGTMTLSTEGDAEVAPCP